jgi:biofilm PGA synthesis N-glycosyltransferase PgaC
VKNLIEILILWFTLLFIFLGVYSSYYLYLRKALRRNQNLKIDKSNLPSVTVMVPVYNEERTIGLKLENLAKLMYPREKLQILLVNDASNDHTRDEIASFSNRGSLDFNTVNFSQRNGKIKALNKALERARGEIIVISDADVFLPPDALSLAMPYFADPIVGGVISREALLDSTISWVTETEGLYMGLTETIKLGESKIHSTLFFHGGFAAYRKSVLGHFNVEADDIGTALDIVQRGSRAIMVPDVVCYSVEFTTWKDKFNAKVRRARHNVETWRKCLSLLIKRELLLPKRIAVPEIFLYLFNPFVLLVLSAVTVYVLAQNFWFGAFFGLAILSMLILKVTRLLFIEVLQNNFFLLLANLSALLGTNPIRWETSQDPRVSLKREMLERKGLL